jgi:hypothetical protein
MSNILLPLEMKIERVEEPASFVMTNSGELPHIPAPPCYRVTTIVLDVDLRRVVSYEFWSMIDPRREPYENIGRTTITPISKQRKRLSELRDALDKLLKEEL